VSHLLWQQLRLLVVRAKPYEGDWRSPKSNLALPPGGWVCVGQDFVFLYPCWCNRPMPRKKPTFASPLELYDFGRVVVYVYKDNELPKHRGLHGHYKHIQTLTLILETLLDLRDDAQRGFRSRKFAQVRCSAVELARYFESLHPRRHGKTVLIRIARKALSIYGGTGDDNVRKPYLVTDRPNQLDEA
jgi:hypothetical protein